MNNEQKSILKTELSLPEYVEKTDNVILEGLLAKNIPKSKELLGIEVQGYLTVVDKLTAIEASTDPTVKKMLRSFVLFPSIDLTKPEHSATMDVYLAALLTNNLIIEVDRLNILDLGKTFTSRSEELKLSDLRLGHVMEARK